MKKKQLLNTEKILPKNTAIIVIDIQNDFCHEKSIFKESRKKNKEIAEKIYNFVKKAENLNVDIIYTQQIFKSSKLSKQQKLYYKNKKHACQEGSFGAQYYKMSPPKNKLFTKYNFDIWQNKKFEKYLNDNNINSLVITGVEIPVCILYTILGADERGFNVIIAKDLISSIDKRYKKSMTMINFLGNLYGPLINSKDLLKLWEKLITT